MTYLLIAIFIYLIMGGIVQWRIYQHGDVFDALNAIGLKQKWYVWWPLIGTLVWPFSLKFWKKKK